MLKIFKDGGDNALHLGLGQPRVTGQGNHRSAGRLCNLHCGNVWHGVRGLPVIGNRIVHIGRNPPCFEELAKGLTTFDTQNVEMRNVVLTGGAGAAHRQRSKRRVVASRDITSLTVPLGQVGKLFIPFPGPFLLNCGDQIPFFSEIMVLRHLIFFHLQD